MLPAIPIHSISCHPALPAIPMYSHVTTSHPHALSCHYQPSPYALSCHYQPSPCTLMSLPAIPMHSHVTTSHASMSLTLSCMHACMCTYYFSSGQEQEGWPGAKCYCICITSSENPQMMSTTAWVYIHAWHGVLLAIPVHKHSCYSHIILN